MMEIMRLHTIEIGVHNGKLRRWFYCTGSEE